MSIFLFCSSEKSEQFISSDLFNVSYHSGAISANPELLAGSQAVYQLKTEAVSTDGKNLGFLMTYVNVYKNLIY